MTELLEVLHGSAILLGSGATVHVVGLPQGEVVTDELHDQGAVLVLIRLSITTSTHVRSYQGSTQPYHHPLHARGRTDKLSNSLMAPSKAALAISQASAGFFWIS